MWVWKEKRVLKLGFSPLTWTSLSKYLKLNSFPRFMSWTQILMCMVGLIFKYLLFWKTFEISQRFYWSWLLHLFVTTPVFEQSIDILAGILVQLPLPKHINEEKVLSEISLAKDVDGFHPLNIGKLAMKDREPLFQPCTPKVIIYLVLNCFQYQCLCIMLCVKLNPYTRMCLLIGLILIILCFLSRTFFPLPTGLSWTSTSKWCKYKGKKGSSCRSQ